MVISKVISKSVVTAVQKDHGSQLTKRQRKHGMKGQKMIDLEAIEARTNAAPSSPWKIYEQPITYHTGKTGVSQMIGQAWDHPQLKAPAPVVGLMYHVDFETKQPVTTIFFDKGTAEFIANAREDIPALIARVRELEAIVKLKKLEVRNESRLPKQNPRN